MPHALCISISTPLWVLWMPRTLLCPAYTMAGTLYHGCSTSSRFNLISLLCRVGLPDGRAPLCKRQTTPPWPPPGHQTSCKQDVRAGTVRPSGFICTERQIVSPSSAICHPSITLLQWQNPGVFALSIRSVVHVCNMKNNFIIHIPAKII